jgi:hypothetical protein
MINGWVKLVCSQNARLSEMMQSCNILPLKPRV